MPTPVFRCVRFLVLAAFACCATMPGLQALTLPIKPPAGDPNSRESLIKEFRDTSDTWAIGFARLEGVGLSSGNATLVDALPRLWKQALGVELQRHLDEATRNKISANLRDAALTKAMGELSQAWYDRDSAWLLYRLDETQAKAGATKIAAAEKRLAALRAFDPAWIQLPQNRKLTVVTPGADSELFPFQALDRRPDRELGKKLQSLVFGQLSEDAGYLFLKLAVWDFVQSKMIWSDEWVLDPRTSQSRVGDQLEAMSEALLGTAAAGLAVNCTPKDAMVTVRSLVEGETGAVVGQEMGGGEFRFLPPGEYRVEISREGYRDRTDTVTLAGGSLLSCGYALEKSESSFFTLQSQPPGARVYYDNRFLGFTPLEVPQPMAKTILVVQAEGYRSARLVLPPAADGSGPVPIVAPAPGVMVPPGIELVETGADPARDGVLAGGAVRSVTLMRDLVNWKTELADRREKAFTSLGLFAISIIPPLFFDGMYKNIKATLPADGPTATVPQESWNRLADEANLFYYLSIGTLVATASFGINFAIDLSAYLGAADLASGR